MEGAGLSSLSQVTQLVSGRLWGSRVYPLNPGCHPVYSNFLLTIKFYQNQLIGDPLVQWIASKTLFQLPFPETIQLNHTVLAI